MPYTIEEHKHRFAAWAASRAASVKGCRFSVEQGKAILERVQLNRLLPSPDNLPAPKSFDEVHREWRNQVISAAQELGLEFTHGVAAKLINVYFKAAFVCGGYHNHVRVKAIHPPITWLGRGDNIWRCRKTENFAEPGRGTARVRSALQAFRRRKAKKADKIP